MSRFDKDLLQALWEIVAFAKDEEDLARAKDSLDMDLFLSLPMHKALLNAIECKRTGFRR